MGRALIAFFIGQIALASWQLTQARPARWGWQMYAGVSQPATFAAIYADREVEIDLSRYLAAERADVDVIGAIPPAVCERDHEVVAVRFRVIPERHSREVRCMR